MKILDPHDSTGWITAIIADRWVQAKVYDEPSDYGVNNGRVSKLSIGKTSERRPGPFFEQMIYHYDRGLDFNDGLTADQLNEILAELEALPKYFK